MDVPKINVYLPDELAAAVKEAQVPVSAICQSALEKAVRDVASTRASMEDDDFDEPDQGRGRFARFTPRARAAVVNAQALATGRVETEHVLLGILDEGANLAIKVLAALDVEPDDVRAELAGSMGPAVADGGGRPHTRFSATSKQALKQAHREALGLGHNYIGCEHLLLGLVAVEDGLASVVLRRMGVDLRSTRRAVTTALSGFVHAQETAATAAPAAALQEILRRLAAIEAKLAG